MMGEENVVAKLFALAEERDELRAEVERLKRYETAFVHAHPVDKAMRGDNPELMARTIIDEREALEAEVERLKEALLSHPEATTLLRFLREELKKKENST